MTNRSHELPEDIHLISSLLDDLGRYERSCAPESLESALHDAVLRINDSGADRSLVDALGALAHAEQTTAPEDLESRIFESTVSSLKGGQKLRLVQQESSDTLEQRIFDATRSVIASARTEESDDHAVVRRIRASRWTPVLASLAAMLLLAAGVSLVLLADREPAVGPSMVDADPVDVMPNIPVDRTVQPAAYEISDTMMTQLQTILSETGVDAALFSTPDAVWTTDESNWCVWCDLVDDAVRSTS